MDSAMNDTPSPQLAHASQSANEVNARVAREATKIAAQSSPFTTESLAADLRALGVERGMTLLVHAAMSKVGWVAGGPVALILALEAAVGEEGTLIMPTFTGDLTYPAYWRIPPIPEDWGESMRQHMPAYDTDLTPTFGMGVVAELFRKQRGVIRSNHPNTSFAAWGKNARRITDNPVLVSRFGEDSPLARIYNLESWVLLLGVTHANNTSMHLAEYRADIPHITMRTGSPVLVDGVRQWIEWEDIDWDDTNFEELGASFARESGLQREGVVGAAKSILVPQRPLIDYAVPWLERHQDR